MIKGGELATAAFTLAVLACLGTKADAAQCGSHAGRFRGLERESSPRRPGQKASAPRPSEP